MSHSMRTLFIAGGSASGKSTLARLVRDRIERDGGTATLLIQDSFYRDRPDGSGAQDRHHFDFDQPDSIHWAEMAAALRTLKTGRAAEVPVYDFAVSRRAGMHRLEPVGELLIVDGILILHEPSLRALADASVFVRADEGLRQLRRERRDVAERGRDIDDIRRQLRDQVFPAHDRYVEPSAAHADLVLDAMDIMDDPTAAVSAVLALCADSR